MTHVNENWPRDSLGCVVGYQLEHRVNETGVTVHAIGLSLDARQVHCMVAKELMWNVFRRLKPMMFQGKAVHGQTPDDGYFYVFFFVKKEFSEERVRGLAEIVGEIVHQFGFEPIVAKAY